MDAHQRSRPQSSRRQSSGRRSSRLQGLCRRGAWRERRCGDDLPVIVAGGADRLDQVDEVVGVMLALADIDLVAGPFERDVEPRELVAKVEPGEGARAAVL